MPNLDIEFHSVHILRDGTVDKYDKSPWCANDTREFLLLLESNEHKSEPPLNVKIEIHSALDSSYIICVTIYYYLSPKISNFVVEVHGSNSPAMTVLHCRVMLVEVSILPTSVCTNKIQYYRSPSRIRFRPPEDASYKRGM